MSADQIPENDGDSESEHRYKCKVRDNQEVGRWKKSEHENFIKGIYIFQEINILFILRG